MKLFFSVALASFLASVLASESQACGRHRGCRHVAAYRPVATVAYAPAAVPALAHSTPQFAQTPAVAPSAPMAVVPGPTATVPPTQPVYDSSASSNGVPAYDYQASPNGVPAYYYTYDRSGKLIVAQWMDWVFRGGRAAGEPAPPLPIIGALRNR